MNYYFLILIFFVAFIIRVLPVLIRKNLHLVDHYFHLGYAKLIRDNKFRLPKTYPNYIIKHGASDYPYLYHYLLAIIPEKFREKISLYLGGIFDIVQMIILIFFINTIEDISGYKYSEYLYYFALIIFALSPSHLRVDSRNVGASARPFGELLLVLSIFIFIQYLFYGHFYLIILTVLIGSLILITSYFSSQAYFFIFIISSFFISEVWLFFIPFLSAFVVFLYTKGHYFRIVKGHYLHLKYMARIKHGATVSYSESLKIPYLLLTSFKKGLEYLYKFPLFIIILYYPVLVILFILLIYNKNDIFPNFELNNILTFIYSSVICLLMTSFRTTKFLGQADRYIESTLLFTVFLVAYLLGKYYSFDEFLIISTILIFYSLIVVIKNLIIWFKLLPSDIDDKELADFLNSKEKTRIITIPPYISYYLAVKTHHDLLYCQAFYYDPVILTSIRDPLIKDKKFDKLPFIVNNLNAVSKKFDLKKLVIKKNYSYMSIYNKIDINELYPLNDYKLVYENKSYAVYNFNSDDKYK